MRGVFSVFLLQMDISWTSLGNLFDIPTSDAFLTTVKKIILDSFPDGWREWRVISSVAEFSIPPNQRNKVRFAIPSVRLVKAHEPALDYLSERRSRAIKERLLSWPLGKALIFSPSQISIEI
uniref:Uncharacterized protein n=1 Tax=Cacopsylla melanoneura TaxID=428564 RepID=A0A8D8WYH8_9HEMI